jgi:hypothetical protein
MKFDHGTLAEWHGICFFAMQQTAGQKSGMKTSPTKQAERS